MKKKLAVVVAALFIIIAQTYIGSKVFLGDAGYYWDLTSYILNHSFPKAYRGYFYPLLLSPAKFLFDKIPHIGYLALYAIQALSFSFVLTILLPNVFTQMIGGHVSFLRRLIPPACVAFFFPGLVTYPLSDLPAICLLIASISLVLSAAKQNSFFSGIVLSLLAGITAYGAYNTRTIYLFAIALIVVLISTIALRGKTITVRVSFTFAFIVGVGLAAVPQTLINLKYLNTPTPLVVANFNNTSLFANQLKWGITVQKYETGYTPESGEIFPIYYVDPTGERIFKDHNIKSAYASIPWYFEIFASEPISFLKIYAKHFFNGLDVRDGDPYTKIRSKDKNLLSLASISISILGLFTLFYQIFWHFESPKKSGVSKQIMPRAIWAFVMLLPVFAILPGAIETRFFLPMHLMAYCSIAFGISTHNIKSLPKKWGLLLSAAYFLTVATAYISARESISNPVYKVPEEYIK